MSKLTVATIQSSYIPWKGYFDQINMADIFVFYDDVQYTKQDWRTRNRIKTAQGLQWLTVPCGEDLNRLICDVRIESTHWQRKHWKSISQNYRKARYFERYRDLFEPFYLEREWGGLSELNQACTRMIAEEILGMRTEFRDSREFDLSPALKKEDRLLELLRKLGADRLVIGPSARAYLEGLSDDGGLEIVYMDYSGYPEYRQLYPPFEHQVSIIDLIMNEGPDAPKYMLSSG
jgi:hypothetical protein